MPASLIAIALLASCGTPEYRAERSLCAAEWTEKIPPRYGQRIVERVKYIRIPTGGTVCHGKGDKVQCFPQYRTEDIPYTTLETYDVNKAERDVQIRACAVKACSVKFGNAECKAPMATQTGTKTPG
ncbi:hypothetical protein [Gemmobacter serpentinus]|uniref:hypothetical protein n=1 Tax=Gemmobacter serpentinus TaxID=2652247 RepID=UPI00124DA65B|nr:hypothetical protein [Gemmobacter serpentinus]